jgi:hypothetical protein
MECLCKGGAWGRKLQEMTEVETLNNNMMEEGGRKEVVTVHSYESSPMGWKNKKIRE